jgi:hypothetical protein
MSIGSPPTPAELVDAYLAAFRDDIAPAAAGRAMVDGYLLDDGTVQFIAPSAVPTRIARLRSATAAEGEQLESWDLSKGDGSGAVAVVRAELRWRSAVALRTHHIDYVVRTSGAAARIIAIVTP